MTATAAASALLFRRRSTLQWLALSPSLELGAGGEARVVALPDDPSLVAKLYHQPTMERARKVALMIGGPPAVADARAALAWPADLLLDARGRFAGFLMPRAEGPRLFELYNPITRRKSGRACDPALLHRAGAHLAAVFDALHARGYVLGDVNESNVLLGGDGTVTLVDADSFQVRDPEGGTVHRSRVGKPEFTPPELQGKTFADFDRTPEHDRFGLGVLLFLALMEGTHPFAGRTDVRSETPPVEERIRRGLFPHHGHPEIHPPKLAPPFSVLDPALRSLFVRCFADGHADPSARPTAAEWRDALTAAEGAMETCGANPRHRFGPHLDACPWCERTALLHGRDPFPAEPAKLAAPRRNPPRATATAAARRSPSPSPAATPAVAKVAVPVVAQTHVVIPPPGAWIAPSLALIVVGGMGAKLLGAAGFALTSLATAMVATSRPSASIVPRPARLASAVLLLAMWLLRYVDLPEIPLPHLPERRAPAPPAERRTDEPGVVRVGVPTTPTTLDAPPAVTNAAAMETRFAGDGLRGARLERPEWCAHLSVYVREEGWVGLVDLMATTPRMDADVARRTAAELRFAPMTQEGRPVAAWVTFFLTCE